MKTTSTSNSEAQDPLIDEQRFDIEKLKSSSETPLFMIDLFISSKVFLFESDTVR